MQNTQQVLQVGVKVLIKNKQEQFLILRRSLSLYPETKGNNWDIPGGRIDTAVSLFENLKREVSEETSLVLDVASLKIIDAQDIIRNDKHVVRLTYTGYAIGECILNGIEHDIFEWVSLDELVKKNGLDMYLKEILPKIK